MNKRLIISFFLAITIVMPSFYPATWIDSRTGGKKKGFPYSECEHVWIDKLNYSEYQQLKMRIRDSFPQIDGLGNPVLGKQEELMEEQGLSNVPGAERVKDKFIMTENGKLLLYDVEKKQVVSPSEACHLSNVIVDGPASYALRTDETIYCTEDKDCGNGYGGDIETMLNNMEVIRVTNSAHDITGMVNALYNNDTDTFRNIVDNDKKVAELVETGLQRTTKLHTLGEVKENVSVLSNEEKRLLVQKITNGILGQVEDELSDYDKPPNRIRSNYVEIALLGPDRLDILVPIHLLQFIGWLGTFAPWDTVYTGLAITEIIANPSSSIGKGATETGTELAEEGAKTAEKGRGVWARLGKGWEKFKNFFKRASQYNRNLRAAAEAKLEEAARIQRGLEKAGGEAEKLGSLWTKQGSWMNRWITTPIARFLRTPSGRVMEEVSGKRKALEKIVDTGTKMERLEKSNKIITEGLGESLDDLANLKKAGIIDVDFLTTKGEKIVGWVPSSLRVTRDLEKAENFEKAEKIVKNPKIITALESYGRNSEKISTLSRRFADDVASANMRYGTRISTSAEKGLSEATEELRNIERAEKYWSGVGPGAITAWKRGELKGAELVGVGLAKFSTRLIGYMAFWSRISHIGMTISYIAVSRYNEYFQRPYFPAQVGKIVLDKKTRDDIKREMYAKTEVHSTWINQNVQPQAGGSAIGTIVSFFSTSYTPDAPNFPEEGLAKGESLGKHIYIVDQVNPLQKKESMHKNIIRTLGGLFYFFSDYDDTVTYTVYEDPASWTPLKGGTYIGVYWETKNADLAEVMDATLAPDLAKEGFAGFANLMYPASRAVFEGGSWASIPYLFFPFPRYSKTSFVVSYVIYGLISGKLVGIGTMAGQRMREGTLVDTKFAYSHKGETCENVMGDKKGTVTAAKRWAGATLVAATVTNFAPEIGAAIAGPAAPIGYAVGVLVDLTADLVNAQAEMRAIEEQERAIKAMSSCLETDIEIASLSRVIEGEDIAKDFSDMPKEMGQAFSSMTNWLEGLSPEAGQIIAKWTKGDVQTQVLHDYVVTTPGEMHLIADRVYDAYFQKADIRWLVDPSCPISFCYQEPRTGAYKCMMSAGYFLLDENGNPILEEPNPMFLSLGVDSDNGYMYMASKVIEIEKNKESKVDPILELYPDGIKTTDKGDGPCLKKRLMSSDMLALENVGDENYVNEQLHEAMGAMDYIQTEKAIIWPVPEENGVKVRFVKGMPPKGCGMNFMGVATFPNATLEFKNDRQGTITLKDDDGNKICDFALGSSGAIVYMRGFIRPGVVQRMGNETYNFSGVYHMFLTGYLAGMSHSLNPEYGPFSGAPSIENCTLPDGTPGYKFVWKFHSPDSDEAKQWQDKAETMCITDGIGDNNNMFGTIIDNKTGQPVISYTYVNEYGDKVTDQYPVQGWKDQTPYDNKPGYEITLPDGSTGYAVMTTDSQGNPQLVITDANGQVIRSLPLALLNSPNGGYHFGDGKVSLSNDFYFPLNPQFVSEGMNGAAFMKPGKPPWGAPSVKPSEERGIKKEQPFLSLPSVPPGTAGIVFAFLVILSLALTREYARKRKKG